MKYQLYLIMVFSIFMHSIGYSQDSSEDFDYTAEDSFEDLDFGTDLTPKDDIDNREEDSKKPPVKIFGFSFFLQGGFTYIFQNHRYEKLSSPKYTMIYGAVAEAGMILDFAKYLYFSISSGMSSIPDDWILNTSLGFHIPEVYLYIGAGFEIPFYVFSGNINGNTGELENPSKNGNLITMTPYLELLIDMPIYRNIIDITIMTRYHFIPHIKEYTGAFSLQLGLKFNVI